MLAFSFFFGQIRSVVLCLTPASVCLKEHYCASRQKQRGFWYKGVSDLPLCYFSSWFFMMHPDDGRIMKEFLGVDDQ